MQRINSSYLVALLSVAFTLGLHAQGTTSFTYSGRLLDNGNPANGVYDLEFTLHSSETNDNPVGNPSTVLRSAVNVTNGLLTTALDFGPDAFNGEIRWLEVRVGPSGAVNLRAQPRPVPLVPRQPVRSVPQSSYARRAMTAVNADTATTATKAQTAVTADTATNAVLARRAQVADTADTATNAVVAQRAQVAVNADSATNAVVAQRARSLDAGTYSNAVSFTSLANSFTGNGAGLTNVIATNVVGTLPQAVIPSNIARANSNVTFTGRVTFNPAPSAAPGLAAASPPCPEPFTVTCPTKVNNLNADLLDGLDSTAFATLNSSPTFSGTVTAGGILWASSVLGTDQGGAMELGDSSASVSLPYIDFHHGVSTPQDFNVRLINDVNGQLTLLGNLLVTGTASPATALHVIGRITTGLDFSSAGAITLRPPDGFAYFHIDNGPSGGRPLGRLRFSGGVNPGDFEFMSMTQEGRVGIGTPAPASKLEVADAGHVEIGVTSTDSSGRRWTVQSSGDHPTLGGTFQIIDRTAERARMIIYPNDGRVEVSALTITGGADLAEPFPMATQDIPKGSVVVIDEAHPGRLKLSERAYDTRVAGVISGAGGINAGIQLTQRGLEEGGQNVALTGRVYVQADATTAPIKPGDLLTTSDTPGHAMKVADHARAQGAVLGKAMTPLREGTGLVLVLVSLQ